MPEQACGKGLRRRVDTIPAGDSHCNAEGAAHQLRPAASMIAESPSSARRAFPLSRWVFLSVLIIQLMTFAGGIVFLMLGGAGAMDNKFRDEALDKFWWYLIWNSAEVFLKAYLPSGL